MAKLCAIGGLSLCAPLALSVESIHHRVRIEGRGASTVIFEAGLGDTLEVWNHVQAQIASHCARTLAYNRAGYPDSDPAVGPRDARAIVAELRAELNRRNIQPPYVLVGHSLGGLYMQYFARQYSDEVAGLVLVDSTHWKHEMQLDRSANTPYTTRRAVVVFMSWIARRELVDSGRAGEQVYESPPAGAVPTIVLSSTSASRAKTSVSRAESARQQEEIAADFPAARHMRVDGSGHYIQNDRPDVVINAAREVAGCSPLHARHRVR